MMKILIKYNTNSNNVFNPVIPNFEFLLKYLIQYNRVSLNNIDQQIFYHNYVNLKSSVPSLLYFDTIRV